MSAPGPDMRWFDIDAVVAAEKATLRTVRVVMAILGAVLLGVAVTAIIVNGRGDDAGTWVAAGFVCVSIAGGAVVGVVLSRKTRAKPNAAGLGVARDGIRWVTTDGTGHVAWNALGGVRIHSTMEQGLTTVQKIHLDLLLPSQPPSILHRIALPDAVGTSAPVAYQFARNISLAVRLYRPDLWRGFTADAGFVAVHFQSWDDPRITLSQQIGSTPTHSNFGARRPY